MIQAIILGIIQGITEFLPVSSTAHLIIIPALFGWKGTVDTLTFDVALHLGTLMSVLIFFARDWLNIIKNERRLLFYIGIATIPAGIAGVSFERLVEENLRSPVIISISLVVIGIVMWFSDKKGSRKKVLNDVSLLDAMIIGIAQAIALIPGVSRSGITISTALFLGLKREDSARFSFLLSTPVILGATIFELRKLSTMDADLNIFFSGVITSFLAGIFAINFLLRFLKDHGLEIFVYYRFLLATLLIFLIY